MAERYPEFSLASKLRFALALLRTSLKAAVALRFAFGLQVVFMALNNWLYFSFWWFLLGRVPEIRGFSLPDVATMNGVVASGFGIAVTFSGGVTRLARLIDDGDLDTLLTQPRATLPYALLSHSRASGIGDLVSGLVLLLVVGRGSLATLPWMLAAIALSALAFIASGILFFSAAFWFGRWESVAVKIWELLITFSLYPEPLFGLRLRLVLFTLLPAGLTAFLPVALLRAPSLSSLFVACAATLGYFAVAVWVFHRGLTRYSSGSRFGVWG